MGRVGAQTSIPAAANDNLLYPQQLQLKLYQAFIFSIPILFSIILCLLLYLFYLKRRTTSSFSSSAPPSSSSISNNLSSQPPAPNQPLQNDSNNNDQATSLISSPWLLGMKRDVIKEKLQMVQFDDNLRAKDISQCCVCLGEFEMEEELTQVPSCKHVFHCDCIQVWLRNSASCPLCRCPVLVVFSKQFGG